MGSVLAVLPRPDGAWTVVRVLAWASLVPMVLVSLWIHFGLSRPSPTLVLTGFQMVLLAPAWPILVGAVIGRRWGMAAVAAFVAVSHLWFCVPAATAETAPGWVRDAPTFTMYSANVLYRSERVDEMAAKVMEVDTDVVVLNEMTDPLRAALEEAGVFERYDTEVYWRGRPFGEMLLTRLPVIDSGVSNLARMGVPWATVQVGDAQVRVHTVHIQAPKNRDDRHKWRANLDAVGREVEARDGLAMVFAGDFNSTVWHGPFRRLLDRGLTEAHGQLGQGLSRSWTSPVVPLRWLGPIMRLDHVLLSEGAWAVEVRDTDTPGSDHRGIISTLAVRPT